MPEAVIVSGARTPIGRAHKGSLVGVGAYELALVDEPPRARAYMTPGIKHMPVAYHA